MTNRRNPFETSDSASPILPSPYDSLRVAAPRQRNRQWERQHLEQKAVYRGVDPKLAVRVKAIAGDLSVPEGEVARALLEHALRAYAQGDLDLYPRPNPERMRMTLYPRSDSVRTSMRPLKARKRKASEASWRTITTWRGFPSELKREIAALASDAGLNVPSGELVTALLRHGLRAYDAGLLKLEPVQKATTLTLGREGEK